MKKVKQLNKQTIVLILALGFPIFGLFCWTVYHATHVFRGAEVVLPIYGYDPRDMLAGHYLTFQIDYGAKESCRSASRRYRDTVYYCVKAKAFTSDPDACSGTKIAGSCSYGGFDIGVNRFYVPEKHAYRLDREISSARRGYTEPKFKIVLSVTGDGRAIAKDMLIEDVNWKEWLKISAEGHAAEGVD